MGGDVSKQNSYELEISKKNGSKVKSSKCEQKIKSGIKTKRSKCWKCGFSLLIINLIINIIVAVTFWCTNAFYSNIYKIVSFHDDGYIFNLWSKPSVARMISVYPFNYTNFNDVKKGLAVPHVQELGPYVFMEHMKKVNVKFHSNGTLTFQENRTHQFVPELSTGMLDDDIILPNFPVLAAHNRVGANLLEYSGVAFLKFATFPDVAWKLKVNDIIWGYDDRFSKVSRALAKIMQASKEDPAKFGILSVRSGLSPDKVTIGSGKPDLNNFAVITRYNGMSSIDAWNDEDCDKIEGSDGSLFPRRMIKPNSTLYIFTKEVCRKIPMMYEKQVITQEGIPALRYRMPGNVFASGDKNPANKCYCKNSDCPPCGTINTAPCNYRLPIFLSYPHFTYADPALREKVSGLKADTEKYQTLMDIHEYGVTVNGVSRLQINVFVNQSRNTPWLNLTDGTVLPLAWIEIRMGKLTDILRMLLYILSYVVPKIEVSLRYLSLIFIFLSFPCLYLMLKVGKYKQVNLQ